MRALNLRENDLYLGKQGIGFLNREDFHFSL